MPENEAGQNLVQKVKRLLLVCIVRYYSQASSSEMWTEGMDSLTYGTFLFNCWVCISLKAVS